MRKVSSFVGVGAAALIALPLSAMSAWAAACPAGPTPIATYIGFGATGCSVDGVTFSNMLFQVNTGSAGSVTVTPLTLGNEEALELLYSAGNGAATDFTWQYTVSGNFLNDAFSSLTGVAPATLSETLLGNGNPGAGVLGQITLNLTTGPSSQTITYAPQSSLLAVKDQATGAAGEASALINGFSLVPAPIVGAGLPGLIAACGCLLGLARRRRRQQVA